MTPDIFVSASLFALATSFTPGPNNAMLLASGVNFGVKRTIPHILGVTVGYAVMFAAVALGVGNALTAQPALYRALQIASAVYMVWLAWRIATAAGINSDAEARSPLTFMEAALFQWVNPKGVAIALAASANFLNPATLAEDLPVMLALLLAVSLASAGTWALFGQSVRRYLGDQRRRRIFNIVMAGALIASIWPMLSGAMIIA